MSENNRIPEFQTERLTLKEVSLKYIDSYEKNFIDYEVIRYLSTAVPWPYPKDGVRDFLTSVILPQQGKDRWTWGIFLNDNPDELIGVVDLWRKGCPENRGFWLA
ncbi:MAG: GNAT family N-acetyltransferase [Bdellovibrionales bacterium]|nr:GNAT family N-acetyltransferase [Bdellovibrionales bacterium]